jgi:hypothetical protein
MPNLTDTIFKRHPKAFGHRRKLYWKHRFRELAIRRVLSADKALSSDKALSADNFEEEFFKELDRLTEGFHRGWKQELKAFNKTPLSKEWGEKCLGL